MVNSKTAPDRTRGAVRCHSSLFQEKMQVKGNVHIEYRTIKEEGPDHDKVFTVELLVNDERVSIGIGSSKKQAEMQAAQKALENK